MKKFFFVLLVVAMAVLPLSAAEEYDLTKLDYENGRFGIGLNLGTNVALGMMYQVDKVDIIGNVGFGFIGGNGLAVELGAMYEVYDIEIDGPHHMPITVGALIPLGFRFPDGGFGMNVGVLAAAGLEYEFPEVPVLLYLRIGLGLDMIIENGFRLGVGYSGAIGCLYMF